MARNSVFIFCEFWCSSGTKKSHICLLKLGSSVAPPSCLFSVSCGELLNVEQCSLLRLRKPFGTGAGDEYIQFTIILVVMIFYLLDIAVSMQCA